MLSEFELHSHLSQWGGWQAGKHLTSHLAFSETQGFLFKLSQHKTDFFLLDLSVEANQEFNENREQK